VREEKKGEVKKSRLTKKGKSTTIPPVQKKKQDELKKEDLESDATVSRGGLKKNVQRKPTCPRLGNNNLAVQQGGQLAGGNDLTFGGIAPEKRGTLGAIVFSVPLAKPGRGGQRAAAQEKFEELRQNVAAPRTRPCC